MDRKISNHQIGSDVILENEFIAGLVGNFERSPLQRNGLQESDAELITLPGSDTVIALTTDSIVEEIERGLYADPYLIGWMTVIVNLSDLAAVGAEPLGLLLNETLPPDVDRNFLKQIQQGIQDACVQNGICVLGGDTNFSSSLQMSATAIGFLRNCSPMTRMGCQPGDALFCSGKLGLGSSFALMQLSRYKNNALNDTEFKPVARLNEGQLLRDFAGCCMDTSDGFIPAIDQLMRLNNVGFHVETPLKDLIHPLTIGISREAKLPLWMVLAGPHGEFELIFTVASGKVEGFLSKASAMDWEPLKMGTVTGRKGFRLTVGNKSVILDTGRIRNLFSEVGEDVEKYIKGLFSFHN